MSRMKDPFEAETADNQSIERAVDLSSFSPQRATVPRQDAIRDIEAISATNGFVTTRPTARRRRGPIRHPWTIRAPVDVRREIESLGETLDLRDDDVIRLLLNHYKSTMAT